MASVQELLYTTAQKYGVDPNLVLRVAQQESGLNQSAVSPAGAIGVMQLMPMTAQELGVDPYDTAQNIEGGVKYLRQMLDRYGGNTSLALAAYNAGPGAVDAAGGIPQYQETQNYVRSVMNGLYNTQPVTTSQQGAEQPTPVYYTERPNQALLRSLLNTGMRSNTLFDAWEPSVSRAQQFIAANRAPSLWAQVPSGVLTEAARHNRAQEDLLGREIDASLQKAAASSYDVFKTAGERKQANTAIMYQNLVGRYNTLLQDSRFSDQPFVAAVESVRRYLTDPETQYVSSKYGIDNYDVVSNFLRTHTEFPSLEALQSYVEAQNAADAGASGGNLLSRLRDMVTGSEGKESVYSRDPLWRLLQSVIAQHEKLPLYTGTQE